MIDRGKLLSDLQTLLRKLEADLLERSDSQEVPEVDQTLRDEYQKAQKANRTAQSYVEWRSDYITQIAAAWVLSCVFARFLEDNRLVDPPKFAGPGDRLARARDEHELYFRTHPTQTDREYLLHIFGELRKLPGAKDIFSEHNAVHELPNWLSGDAAGELLKFFQRIDANTGVLVHNFTDPSWDTRFLGDLYQDLSEAARKKYALLQTPIFVEEFILDRTLDPAIEEFGLEGFRMIDPASGSGHFLLGSFHRILQRWQKKEPGTNIRVLVQRALDSINGVDVNPYAVGIARFRLLLVALQQSGISRLMDAPDFHFNLTAGDSLLHGAPGREQEVMAFHELAHHYQSENLALLGRILRPGTYHTVVANPPYITVKDRALNQAYRDRYFTCHMKYSLSVPFLERIFRLAVAGGYTGQITANSFMKREFGKKLIETFFPTVDLTHVIDTSGAYIPGHGTPTVILFGRHRPPLASTLRTVMGIRGEPSTPSDPARALVWSAIIAQVDRPGSQSEFVSVGDSARELFHTHPWSIGGGGLSQLKERLEEAHTECLAHFADSIGVVAVTAEDDAYVADGGVHDRFAVPRRLQILFVEGDTIRDWVTIGVPTAIFPYDRKTFKPLLHESVFRRLWPLRTDLCTRLMFRKTQIQRGLHWFEYGMLIPEKLSTPLSLIFAAVATHNHVVLDEGGRIFKQSTIVIKLTSTASEGTFLALLGFLNSSTVCFWVKQECYPKERATGDISTEKMKPETNRYDIGATAIGRCPVPAGIASSTYDCVRKIAKKLHAESRALLESRPTAVLHRWTAAGKESLRELLKTAAKNNQKHQQRMVALQEELDWEVYRLCGLAEGGACNSVIDNDSYTVVPQMRPFAWKGDFAPANMEYHLAKLYAQRKSLILNNSELALIEDPMFKRPWWGRQGIYGRLARDYDGWTAEALVKWLLGRLESYFDFDGRMNEKGQSTAKLDVALVSVAKLADVARQDAEFLQVGELYRGDPAFDVPRLVAELVIAESVPLLPVLRYKASGLRKRDEWETTWELQRHEDTIDARAKLPRTDTQHLTEHAARDLKRQRIGNIPVPPKYDSKDFLDSTYWRLRGKLDVPKERWVSFSYCEGEDGQMVIAWAGYDHIQLARAINRPLWTLVA